MQLDVATLMIAGAITTALSGVLLMSVWTQIRREVALLWWATANFTYAVGIAYLLVGLSQHQLPALLIGLVVSNLCPAMIWAGTRRFGHRRIPFPLLLGGTAVWIAASIAPVSNGPNSIGALVAFLGWVTYLIAAAWELWRDRGAERLPARWALIALFVVHAAVYAGGAYDVLSGNFVNDGMPPLASWFGLIYFEGLFYSMGTAIFMALICRERSEQKYLKASHTDGLTQIANRGAFLERAERTLRRYHKDGAPVSFIMFDLDRFKWINDTFGHAAGDVVLRTFADTTRAALRPGDLFGRYGGEEFAVMLPGATVDVAFVIAERVRHNFAEACASFDERPMNATVSAGVASTAAADATMDTLMRAADRSLYRAKNLGRNRVERASDGHGQIARVA